MKKHLTKAKLFSAIAFVLMFSLVIGVLGTTATSTAKAAETTESTIKIAHITDVHYFPFEDCNIDQNILDNDALYEKTDFFKKMCTDSKLCRESGTILNATFKHILAQNPDYLIVSGDNTRDSERKAHADVANALRWLQNEFRKIPGKENFQVFAIPGNHDLVNTNANKFGSDGNRAVYPEGHSKAGQVIPGTELAIGIEEFKYIYAGLGYPNISSYSPEKQEEIKSTYVSESEEYGLFAKGEYIESDNAANLTFEYYGDIIGYPTSSDRKVNCLSYIATCKDNKMVLCGLDSTEREKSDNRTFDWEHATGGHLTLGLLNWLQEKSQTNGWKNNNYTVVATAHHNIVPHYSMEENLTKDFTMYNWEDCATRLADDIGIRYIFTGHMHATDQAYFQTYNGNTITDFETGSTISLGSPARFTTIKRTLTEDSVLLEDVSNRVLSVNTLAGVQSFHINAEDPSKIKFDGVTNLRKVFEDDIYHPLVRHLVAAYVNEDLPAFLHNLIEGVLPEKISVITLPKSALMKIVDVVIGDIVGDIASVDAANNFEFALTDSEGVKKTYDNIIDYVDALLNKLFNIPVYEDPQTGEVTTFERVLIELYMGHLVGGEPVSTDAMLPKFKAAYDLLITDDMEKNLFKRVLDTLLDALLDNDDSLLPLLLEHKFDIGKIDYTEQEKHDITNLFGTLKTLVGIDLNEKGYICLNEVIELPFVKGLLSSALGLDTGDQSLLDWGRDTIDKYLTTSLYTGLGGIVAEIAASFGTDSSPDAAPDTGELPMIFNNGSKGVIGSTYNSGKTITPTASYENGLLPSHVTATFGDTTDKSVNISFYTNHAVDGQLKYRKKGETEWKTATVTTETKPVRFPLIDVGLFATYTDIYIDKDETIPATFENRDQILGSVKFANIHSVTITGLEPNTEYEYDVAGIYNAHEFSEYESGVLGENYRSFKTALSIGNDTAFDVLAITDIQAMVKSDYIAAKNTLSEINDKFDFIANCGDVVDNGKNIKQWSYSQNILSGTFGHSLTVVAAGNHEDDSGALDAYYNFGNIGDVSEQDTTTGVYYSFVYGNAKFIVVNTNDADAKDGLGKTQLKWLNKELDDANAMRDAGTIDWIIVMQHKGLYSSGSHSFDPEVVKLREQLTPVYFDKNVDLVLQGHDHVYNTTQFLDRNGTPVRERTDGKTVRNPKGVLYITLGTIGNKYYEYRDNEFVTDVNNPDYTYGRQLENPTYALLHFNGKTLTINNYMSNNHSTFDNEITIDNGASFEKAATVKLESVRFKNLEVTENFTTLTTADALLGDLAIERSDYGFTEITVNGEKITSNINKALTAGVNEIEVKLIPETNDSSAGQVVSLVVYVLSGKLTVNGTEYTFGDDVVLPSGTKKLVLDYDGEEKISASTTDLKGGANGITVSVVGDDGTTYSFRLNVTVPKNTNTVGIVLGVVGGVLILAGIIIAVVVSKKRNKDIPVPPASGSPIDD